MTTLLVIAALTTLVAIGATNRHSASTDPTVRTGHTPPLKYAQGEGAEAQRRCRSARLAVPYYRHWFVYWRDRAEHGLEALAFVEKYVPDLGKCTRSLYVAQTWRTRARDARQEFKVWWRNQYVLIDTDWWEKAVDQAERIFPGARAWLMSCSSAEGGHGRWVVHGGGAYYAGAEQDAREVGGPMQYTIGTFRSHYARAVSIVRARGFIIPQVIRDPWDVYSWRSHLAQALAAGYAWAFGQRFHHWDASVGSGC